MKKFAIIMAGLLLGGSAFAQTVEDPNRLLLRDNGGNTKSYVLDRVEELSFAKIDGEVKAEVQVLEVTANTLKVSVTRTPACQSYKLAVLPQVTASQFTNDASAISYINNNYDPTTFYEDYTNADLSGVELRAGGDYSIMTIGIDEYNTEVGVCRADFSVPSVPVVGDPKVECTLVKADLTSFTVSFKPNSDVSSYYCVAGEKGEMENQYQMFGPMFGVTSLSELIRTWGIEREGDDENTWTEMTPNTEYEIYIVALDKKGNPAPYQIFECSTQALGGPGEAKVTITPGDYVLANWDNQMLPSQFVTFTPNDQASCYRYMVYPKDQYEANRDAIRAQLCSDPDMPMAYWFFYEELTTDFQINQNQTVVMLAAAKNINGEWGPINELYYTTPAEVQKSSAMKAARVPAPKRIQNAPGRIPAAPAFRKLTLTQAR